MINVSSRSLLRSSIALVAMALAAGCSFLGNFESKQCDTQADCERLGPEFAGRTCSSGICVASVGEAGPDAIAGGCKTNVQCVQRFGNIPYMCEQSTGTCKILGAEGCFSDGADGAIESDDPFYFGVFANLPDSVPQATAAALNVRLAMQEIESAGKLRRSPGEARSLVAIVCPKAPDKIEAATKHLIENLGVKAIISQLETRELKTLMEKYAVKNDVLVISTLANDPTLTSGFADGKLLWHAIGDMTAVAPAYEQGLALAEKRVRAALSLAPSENIRVFAIKSSSFDTNALAKAAEPSLKFNGKLAASNAPDNYRIREVQSLYDSKDATYGTVVQEIVAFKPHVIISFAGDEFATKIIPDVETLWDTSAPRPRYIGSPLNRYNVSLYTVGPINSKVAPRFMGIDFAGNAPAYKEYESNFISKFKGATEAEGFHYLYDATYLLAYGVVAAGATSVGGTAIEEKFDRVSKGSQDVFVGIASTTTEPAFFTASTTLLSGAKFRLVGTTGPFDLDLTTGSRNAQGAAVYCIRKRSDGVTSFVWNEAIFDPSNPQSLDSSPCP